MEPDRRRSAGTFPGVFGRHAGDQVLDVLADLDECIHHRHQERFEAVDGAAAIANYHYDQWLRLWLLGRPPNSHRNGNGRRGKFESRQGYRTLLERVFNQAVELLEEDATIYVRTDSREFTYRTTLDVLRKVFPDKQITEVRRPMLGLSQTRLFGGKTTETGGEVDLIFRPQ